MVVESVVQKSDRVRAKKKLAWRKEEGKRERGGGEGNTEKERARVRDRERRREKERDKRAN